MDRRRWARGLSCLTAFFLVISWSSAPGPCRAGGLREKQEIGIGILWDGEKPDAKALVTELHREIQALMGSSRKAVFSDERLLAGRFSLSTARQNYETLLQDRDVDIILSIGVLNGVVVSSRKEYPKPVIAAGIIDPDIQGIPATAADTSGIHNLTYVWFGSAFARDLDVFQSVYPYRRVALLVDRDILAIDSLNHLPIQKVVEKAQASFVAVPVGASVDEVLERLAREGEDAVYIGYIPRIRGAERQRLVDALNERKLPTFSGFREYIDMGVLASNDPGTAMPKILRRIALDVERIVEGTDPADLTVSIDLREELTLNLKTARLIGFSPRFVVLAKANIVHEQEIVSDRVLDLRTVMQAAREANLDLKVETLKVEAAREDVGLARAKLLPFLDLSANGAVIDRDRAAMGMGAERSLTGSADLSQLVYSDQALGNLSMEKHGLEASRAAQATAELDVLLDAGVAYLEVLKAKAALRIRKLDRHLTRENLELARLRQAAGYSGPSDVYRWESELATQNGTLIGAMSAVKTAEIRVNRVLNRPLDEEFTVQDAKLTDPLSANYMDARCYRYIDNPASLHVFVDFLVTEALKNSPERAELEAAIAAADRAHTIFGRQRFLPRVGLAAQADQTFARGGRGSRVPDVSGNLSDPPDTQWQVGLTASLPLFQGGEIPANREKSALEVMRLRAKLRDLEQALEQAVREAILNVVFRGQNMKLSREASELADKSLELVQDEYSKGRVKLSDLRDAQNVALTASTTASTAVYELHVALLRLERAVGKFQILGTDEQREAYFRRFEAYFKEHTDTAP